MTFSYWPEIHTHILELEQEGLVTRTFRRLDPDRQQAILIAILDEAAEKGPSSVNIKQVAERAGVSTGSLYTYFNKREGLLDFAVELCIRYLTASLNSFRPYFAELPLREALVSYLTGGIEWSRTQAGLLRLFARAAYHGDPELAEKLVRPIATALREVIHDILVQAAARGEIRADVDLEATTRIIHALMIAVGDSMLLPYLNTYFQVTDEAVAPEQVVDALLALILRGIGTATGTQEPGAAKAE
jgi:AcrR family transcriptional regulator